MWDDSPRLNNGKGNGFRDDYMSFNEYGEQGRGEGPAAHTYGGLRQMEQTSATSARERFAQTGMNPYATLHYINRELMELGLPSPLLLPELPECLEDNQRVVECLLALVEQRKRDTVFREQMDDELRVAMGSEDLLRSTIERLERELEQSQRDLAMTRMRLQESERAADAMAKEKKALSAEVQRARSNAASARAQYLHEGKRREQEAVKLKDRVQKLIVDKHRSAKLEFVLANGVVRDRSGRPVDSATREQRLLEELVGKYEDNERQLAERIELLEKSLQSLGDTLGKLHGTIVGDEEIVQVVVERDGKVDMSPFVAVLESIRKTVADERQRHRELATADPVELAARDARISELEGEIAKLNSEIRDLQRIMAEQKKVMDMTTSRSFGGSYAGLNESFSGMSLEEIERERMMLQREKDILEAKHKDFATAYVEMGNEREALRDERRRFEAEKASAATQEVLANLPPTPQWMKGADMAMSTPAIVDRLRAPQEGTPTNAFLSSLANSNASAGSASPRTNASSIRSPSLAPTADAAPRQAFLSINDSDAQMDVDGVQQQSVAPPESPARVGTKRSATESTAGTPSGRSQSRGYGAVTPTKPQGTRTPVEVRTGKQPRVCTRPGCAAHAPHTHDDGTPAPRMELKPPVPRFRRRTDADRSESPVQRPASQAAAAAASATTHAAEIFK
ncbi:hypothetical protein FBU59_003305 [Linderina macrospora]|uniref:Uncharacterized protein n=1 Tax=Linderina macrospora TaxID=4868 RepID=A0ACC1J8Z6_9FUNG|nr:hypothetical protein FBU59_003305 [Linderina macrospora]